MKYFVPLFLSSIFYFVKQITKCATERNKIFNIWSLQSLHALFKKIIPYKGQIFMMSTQRGGG